MDPHGLVRQWMDLGDKPECQDGGGCHRIDYTPTVDQDLDYGIGNLREGGEDGGMDRVFKGLQWARGAGRTSGSQVEGNGERDGAL